MRFKLFFLALAVVIQTASNAQGNPLVKYLPENTATVMSFDMLRLAAKIPPETFRQSFIYREMMKDPGMPMNSFFSSPLKMGIDFSAGMLLTVTNTTDSFGPDPHVNLFIKLSDANLFNSNLKTMLKGNDSAIHIYGNNRILIPGNQGPAMGWNNEVLVINMSEGNRASKEIARLYNMDSASTNIDSVINPLSTPEVMAILEKYKKLQREEIFTVLTPHPQNNFTTNTAMLSLLQTAGDIKMWSNGSGNPMMGNKMMPFADLLKKVQEFSGKNRVSVLNFEKGKIVTQSHVYTSEAMAAIYKKYPVEPINTDLIKRLPPGKILALASSSYNSAMSSELLQQSGFKEIVDSFKSTIPFDISLFRTAFKSNALFALIKTDVTEATDSITKKLGGLQLVIAMPVNDKAAFEKLKAGILPFWDKAKRKEKNQKMFKGISPVIKNNGDLLVLSLSPATANSFLANTGSGTVPEWVESHSGYPMVMGLEFSELMKMLMSMQSKGQKDEKAGVFASMFDKMIIYGGNYENESLNSTMEFRFSNTEDNALKQLFELINMAAEGKGGSPKIAEGLKG